MFHLSVSSLRHYEAAGLLKPEYVDEKSGYRYYSTRQFEVLNTIRYLRALDMPLPRIAEFLQDRDVERIEKALRQQKEEVIKKQQELKRIERKIDNRLAQLKAAQTAQKDVIQLVTTKPCRLVWMEGALNAQGFLDLETPIRKLEKEQQEAMVFLGKIGVGISKEHLCAGQFFPYDGIFLLPDVEDHYEGTLTELPETLCMEICFQGSHPEAPLRYQMLMDYAKEHELEIGGFSREITMIDDGLTSHPEKFVTQIRVPVVKKK